MVTATFISRHGMAQLLREAPLELLGTDPHLCLGLFCPLPRAALVFVAEARVNGVWAQPHLLPRDARAPPDAHGGSSSFSNGRRASGLGLEEGAPMKL